VLQGQVEEAAALDREGLALARRHPTRSPCVGVLRRRGDPADARRLPASEALSAEGATLAEEHGFPHVLGIATINRGWAMMMQGHAAIGIPMLREGVAAVEATGAALMHSAYLGMLAAADAMEGDRAAALRCFDKGLAEAQISGERLNLADCGSADYLLMRGGNQRTSRATMEEAIGRGARSRWRAGVRARRVAPRCVGALRTARAARPRRRCLGRARPVRGPERGRPDDGAPARELTRSRSHFRCCSSGRPARRHPGGSSGAAPSRRACSG
jgi:hypothetical protein